MRESKDPKTRSKGESLTKSYQRLQASSAVFEVKEGGGREESHGDLKYDGNNHFTVNLEGDPANGLNNNQKLAHQFEHGRQVLDNELSYQDYTGKWVPFDHDLTDEAKAFAAGFDIERASPGEGAMVNSFQQALDQGGFSSLVNRLGQSDSPYRSLPKGPIDVDIKSPHIYSVPK